MPFTADSLAGIDSTSNFTGRMAEAGRRKNVYETTDDAILREDRRRANAASILSLMRRTDPYGDLGRIERSRDQDEAMYDLEYRAPIRERLKGDVDRIAGETRRGEQLRDAYAEQNRFFAQDPMRTQKNRESMDALRQRYTDPAIIKGEAEYQRELARGRSARDVAGITGGSRERQEATRQFGDVAGAQALAGDAAAAASGRQQLEQRMPQAPKAIGIGGPRGLQAFADDRGITLDEAIAYAESQGYTVTR